MLITILNDILDKLDSEQITMRSIIESRLNKIAEQYLDELVTARKLVEARGQKSALRRMRKNE